VPPPADEAARWLARLREGKPEQTFGAGGVEP
jgi:prephenate dehydratase